jgi:glucans biosynthesis protein
MRPSRRDIVASLLPGAAISALGGPAHATGGDIGQAPAQPPPAPPSPLQFGPPQPFSFAALDEVARRLAQGPYAPKSTAWGDRLKSLDFDALGQITYRSEAALWKGDTDIGSVEFFHLGRYARAPVAIHEVADGQAREVVYDRTLFQIPTDNPAQALPANLGFAGFRVMNPHAEGDWIAYLGASYFRAADPFNQYGLSARGLAIDTGAETPEEFPIFSAFWLERTPDGLLVHALLEGPSVTGAYRIAHQRGPDGLVQAIEARLNFRAAIHSLGVAPLTSMYWYGADDRPASADWRPQIHDSDGLSLWTGTGERIWRPLTDPPRVTTNTFLDRDPKGFGLMQRDRLFTDYQDDGAFYERRPSAWVEPVQPWGPGRVQLVELPTHGETEDNIVAFWTPERAVQSGDSLTVAYNLHWAAREPAPPGVAQVAATWRGRGGRPGQPPAPHLRKYVVDFEGGRLDALNRQSGVVPVVTLSAGEPIDAAAYPVVGTGRWRLMFDVAPPPSGALDLRAFLRLGEEALTETWIEQVFGLSGA